MCYHRRMNVCKFVNSEALQSLHITKFILETDVTRITTKITLSSHRLLIVKQGSAEFSIGANKYKVMTGEALFAFINETVSAKTENAEIMYIDFDGIRADELFSRFDISVVNRLFDGFDGVIPMWQQSLLRTDEQTIDIIAESMLLYGFSNLPPKTSAQNSIVNKMLDMCQKNFCDSDFSLNYIADKLCYNPKYLSHLFKQKMNVGFSEYLRTLRINYAITLFDNGLDSIKNVALLSGFSDPLYFSSVFKKTVGKSPKDYICAS